MAEEKITDTNNCIRSGLRADIMRCSMENKNLLSSTNQTYIGTGESVNGIPVTQAFSFINGKLSLASGGELVSTEASTKSFQSGGVYSNLSKTFYNYTLNNSNFIEEFEYDNLKLTNDNFDHYEYYTNLSFVPNNAISVSLGGKGTLSLERSATTGVMSLKYEAEQSLPTLYRVIIYMNLQSNGYTTKISYCYYTTTNPGNLYNIYNISDLCEVLKETTNLPTSTDGSVYFFPMGGTPGLTPSDSWYEESLKEFQALTRGHYRVHPTQIAFETNSVYSRGPWTDNTATISSSVSVMHWGY